VKYRLQDKIRVVAGEHLLNEIEGREQIRTVRHVFIHDEYNWSTDENDIAALVLNTPLEYNDYVKPIKHAQKNQTNFLGRKKNRTTILNE